MIDRVLESEMRKHALTERAFFGFVDTLLDLGYIAQKNTLI